VVKTPEDGYFHPTTPTKSARFGPQRKNALRRPKKAVRQKSASPPLRLYYNAVSGEIEPASAPFALKDQYPFNPKFKDVPRVLEKPGNPLGERGGFLSPLNYISPTSQRESAANTIRRQSKFGLFIDTSVPIIDERIIDLSDQFDHFEYFQRRYVEWHTIPLHQIREQEMLSLYNRVIRRSFDMGLITRQYSSSIIAMTGDENAFERDVQNFMNVYSKFPIEEVPTELKKLGDSLKTDYGALFAPSPPLPGVPDFDLDDPDFDLDMMLNASRSAKDRRRKNSF
jgi:hypothetical protein